MDVGSKNLDSSENQENFIERLLLNLHTMIPAKVTKVNIEENTLEAQPQIRSVIQREENIFTYEDRPLIINIPITLPYSQILGLSITVPIQVGDDILLIASERSIDNFWTTGDISNPVEPVFPRHHDFSDSFAILGAIAKPKAIVDYQTDAIEIRNKDRTTRINLKDESIEIRNKAGTNILLNGNGDLTGNIEGKVDIKAKDIINIETEKSINIVAPEGITIDAPTIETNSLITSDDSIIAGRLFSTHVHTDVTPGPADTGPPA